jgi:hypothetical protein
MGSTEFHVGPVAEALVWEEAVTAAYARAEALECTRARALV